MTYVLIALILLLVLDIGRLRARLGSFGTLDPSHEDPDDAHDFLVAPGVTLDAATKRAASAYARREKLEVIDLVPRDLPALRAMGLAAMVDPAALRRKRLEQGRTAGHAMLVSKDVAARAQITPPDDEVALVKLAIKLKTYAPSTFAMAVAPDERAAPQRLERRKAILRTIFGPSLPVALLIQPLFLGLLAWGTVLHPILGGVALGIWHLQPLGATLGTRVSPRDALFVSIARAPLELYFLIRTVTGTWKPRAAERAETITALRPVYAKLLADESRFFEPRRETCPVCGARDLRVYLRIKDMIQHKPGRFTLERCRACDHIFQNPRLSLAGLDYYYKDFYDGLGEEGMEYIFGSNAGGYRARALMMREAAKRAPKTWLDVGAGHGHFCCAAREELPETRFDGLDLSDSIDEAKRRRWIETSYRGLFPDLAPSIAGRYEALSMCHYLEHTLDPRRELEAAHVALAPEGHLLIELPDPEFKLGRALGRWWLPWFQPQHQHLLSTKNLDKLLREHGFTPLAWDRGTAHQRVDFAFATWLFLGRLAPPTDVPWRKPSAVGRVWRGTVFTIGAPLLLLAWIADHTAGPLIERGKRSNTYRVLAQRNAA